MIFITKVVIPQHPAHTTLKITELVCHALNILNSTSWQVLPSSEGLWVVSHSGGLQLHVCFIP